MARTTSPLSGPPPRKTRFGSPLVLSRVHWVEPQLVAEITYLTWTGEGLLRQTVYVGLREDKPADWVSAARKLIKPALILGVAPLRLVDGARQLPRSDRCRRQATA